MNEPIEKEQDEQHNMEIWRGEVNMNLREMTKSLAEVNAVVSRLPTRPEIEAMLLQKVNIDVFRAEVQGLRDDINTLKSNPGKVRDWLSTGISAGVGCLSLVLAGLSLLVSMLIATHVIH